MAFLDQNYLLPTQASRELYAQVENLPIIDAHNHCDVKALAENQRFSDIWEAEAATDHYVWELLRKAGVPETLITGKETSNHEKWSAMAAAFDSIAGNPTYEWIHLDLKRRLNIHELINAENADVIWEKAKAALSSDNMTQQDMIKQMNVETMCSTDDPADTLEYHQKLQDSPIKGIVRPTFRPDKAMNIALKGFPDYIEQLGARWNASIRSVKELIAVLQKAHDFFAENGCAASDHGIEIPYGYQVAEQDADRAFQKAMKRQALTHEETIHYISYVFNEVAEMDAKKDWVFQIHIGPVRNVRDSLYKTIGPDAGGDISDHLTDYVTPLLPMLNRFDGRLKTVLYNMNAVHNATLATLTRAFGNKVSLGMAWWLNDTFIGMKNQLELAGSIDVMSNMAGMVSDSRKILSYGSRHELFRRTLCHVLGNQVELGQYPMHIAQKLAADLSYNRPKNLFFAKH